jgi:hypothetical protein
MKRPAALGACAVSSATTIVPMFVSMVAVVVPDAAVSPLLGGGWLEAPALPELPPQAAAPTTASTSAPVMMSLRTKSLPGEWGA